MAMVIAGAPFPSVAEERCWCRWLSLEFQTGAAPLPNFAIRRLPSDREAPGARRCIARNTANV